MKRKNVVILAAVFVLLLICTIWMLKPADIETETYQFLLKNGFSPIQASGIMASIKMNSNFDPTATAPNDLGYGLLQWTYIRFERLEKFSKEIGKPINDAETQLLFMMEELNPESEYYIPFKSYMEYKWDDFENAKNPKEAAENFMMVYTAPYKLNEQVLDKLAEEFYQQYAN